MFDKVAPSYEGQHAKLAEIDETAQPKSLVQQIREIEDSTGAVEPRMQVHQLRYLPTGRAYADLTLDIIDRFTGGHADWFQRAFSYLLIGGFAAMVNLIFFYIVYYRVSLPVDQTWHYVVAFEIGRAHV